MSLKDLDEGLCPNDHTIIVAVGGKCESCGNKYEVSYQDLNLNLIKLRKEYRVTNNSVTRNLLTLIYNRIKEFDRDISNV